LDYLGLIVVPNENIEQNGRSIVVKGASGGAIAREVVLKGKTLTRLGGESFYVSGSPQPGMRVPQSGSTSEFFIFKKSNPNKLFRLDYGELDSGGGKDIWHYNQKGVNKIKGLQATNHSATRGSVALGKTLTIFKWGGRALFVAGVAVSALEIYSAEDRTREAVIQAAGWAGAFAGGWVAAKLGTAGGAAVGAFFGGVGAVPGALIGGFIGGVAGGIGGWWAGSAAAATVYDWYFTPLEKEEWEWICVPKQN